MQESSIFGNTKTKSEGVLGFDLGTTNSVITVKFTEGVPKVLESLSGATTPSCVTFNEDGTVEIGSKAYAKRSQENTVYSFKKYMGTNKDLYKGKVPNDVAAIFTKNLVEEVKANNPEFANYNSIHVSVPAYFDMNQREDTKLALEKAGYEVTGIMDEPTAAALVYQQIKRVTKDILVFDLGGGTFDAVLVRNVPGIPLDTIDFYNQHGLELPESESILEILDVTGDNRLGGDDIDELAVEYYIEDKGIEVDAQMRRNLIIAAENVKKTGSPEMVRGTRDMFLFKYVERATEVVLGKAISIMDEMLNRAKVYHPNCVLCGGSTKSRIIRDTLGKRFEISTDIDPDLAVGVGNSVQNWMNKTDTGTSIVSRLAKGIGILVGGRIVYLAEKGSVYPLTTKFSASNSTPFADFVNVELYQGDRLTGENTKISTIKLDNLTGHNDEGFVTVIISLTITKNGTISVKVAGGEASVEAVLSITSEESSAVAEKLDVHPDAKMYARFKKAAEHYDHLPLDNLVDKYRQTGERELAKEIAKRLGELATMSKELESQSKE